LYAIPVEEVFFFVIQTYNTSLLYLFVNKATFHPIYLRPERTSKHLKGPANELWRFYKLGGQLLMILALYTAGIMFKDGGKGTYMALIIGWAVPFLLLLW
jgi:15-cis-phytoene synthase/lycopene beta-cyclase